MRSLNESSILEKAVVVIKEDISITHYDTKAMNQVQDLKSTIEGLVNIVEKEEEKKIIYDLQNRLLVLEKRSKDFLKLLGGKPPNLKQPIQGSTQSSAMMEKSTRMI